MTSAHVPEELAEWMTSRIDAMAHLVAQAQASEPTLRDDPAAYVLSLLDLMSDVDTQARRAIYLLTTYIVRSQVATATEAARASKVTLTGAMNRTGSKLAQDTWNEVFAAKPRRSAPGRRGRKVS